MLRIVLCPFTQKGALMNAPVPELLSLDACKQRLIETMQLIRSRQTLTVEEQITALSELYASHSHVVGTFTAKQTIWGFPELIFTGSVLGESISISVW